MCEDLTSAMDSIPTCFKGAAQSPIDLNSNVAIPGDPGAIVFQDYDVSFHLGRDCSNQSCQNPGIARKGGGV